MAVCGTRSGRDTDKLLACGFHTEKGILIRSPYIRESIFHYECRIIHKHRLDPETLDRKIMKRYYPQKDYHMVYYGEILGTFVIER
jgi:flavin reductase (DIM6/NTAB) family NADH-FMN oxidoreductase RutF